MDREAWWATVHRVAKSPTSLKRIGTHIRILFQTFISFSNTLGLSFNNLCICVLMSFSFSPIYIQL